MLSPPTTNCCFNFWLEYNTTICCMTTNCCLKMLINVLSLILKSKRGEKMNNKIKFFRENRKVDQKKLAKELGITQQAISLYERGKREPSSEIWEELSKYFGIPVPFLKGEAKPKHYTKDDILKILQLAYNDSKGYKVNEKGSVIINNSVNVIASVNRYMLIKSVLLYLNNSVKSKKEEPPHIIEITDKQANDLNFWKKEFSFIFKYSYIKQFIEKDLFDVDDENIQANIANAINEYSLNQLQKVPSKDFFNGMMKFINSHKINNKNFLNMVDTLSLLDKKDNKHS